MYRYKNNEYELTKLTILKELEGKKYKDLPASIKNKLDYKTQINVEIIDVFKNEKLEYEVFTRFNQATNPLSQQELNEVVYRSEFSLWVKEKLMNDLYKMPIFTQIFKCTEKRIKDKKINYYLYSYLGYAYSGLIEGKNDTPFYVEGFMTQMKKIDGEKLQNKKEETKNFIMGFLEFCRKICFIEDIESIFSKEFISKKKQEGNHSFLISFLIPLTLTYDYLLYKGIFKRNLSNDSYHEIYLLIINGMEKVRFGNFGGVSSTSYRVQKQCIDSIKQSLSNLRLNK